MRRALVGYNVGFEAPFQELRENFGRVAEQADPFGAARQASVFGPSDRLVDVLGRPVEVARVEAPAYRMESTSTQKESRMLSQKGVEDAVDLNVMRPMP